MQFEVPPKALVPWLFSFLSLSNGTFRMGSGICGMFGYV